MLGPSAQPTHLPIIEPRAQFHRRAKAKKSRFHGAPFVPLWERKGKSDRQATVGRGRFEPRLLTERLRVRDLFGEPNLSATSFLRLLVNGRQASTPQNGQYLRNKDTLCGRSGLGYSPRMPRRRWFGSTFSDSPARDELLVNGHKAIRSERTISDAPPVVREGRGKRKA